MRTLPAALETAFDSLQFDAYIRVRLGSRINLDLPYAVQVIKYKLDALEASVSFEPPTTLVAAITRFQIERGAIINGAPVTIKSAFFYVTNAFFDGMLYHLEGHVLQPSYKATLAADQTYTQILDTFFSNHDLTIEDPAAAWLNYIFLPSARSLNDSRYLVSLLRQKYLIFIREDSGYVGAAPLQLHTNVLTAFVASKTITEQYNVEDLLFVFNTGLEARQFLWRDENASIYTQGNATDAIHNLGYLESTDSPPDLIDSPRGGSKAILPIHLKYQTGDYITINPGASDLQTFTGRVEVTEILDTSKSPAWFCEIKPLAFFTNTEGGALPSTIERIAAYTPLVTTNFDGTLDASVNNLQSLAERVDDMPIGGGIPNAIATNDFLIGAQVAGVWTWVRNTLAQAVSVLRTSLDPVYAPIAKGVTNGNSHNHVGGDGAALIYQETIVINIAGGAIQAVPAGATYYCWPGTATLWAGLSGTGWPVGGTLKNLYVRLSTAQPWSGGLSIVLQTSFGDTALSIWIPAGSAGAVTHSNLVNTAVLTAGNFITWKIVNYATATSGALSTFSMSLERNTA